MSNDSQIRSLNVLLADDEAELRIVLTEFLKTLGHRVIQAADGQQAYDLYHANQNDLDLIISDICMPVLNGIELGKRIRNDNQHIPIVFITGFSQEHELKIAENIGNRVFKKPINYQDLESFIAAL